MTKRKYFARTREDDQDPDHWQKIEKHLLGVAELAKVFASAFQAEGWAYLGGLWHDLGKYRLAFQRYLFKMAGLDPGPAVGAAIFNKEHSIVGAIHACERFGKIGRILAYPIAGHHGGLPDWDGDGLSSLNQRLTKKDLLQEISSGQVPSSIFEKLKPAAKPPAGSDPALWIRMIFSCLVDADYLDTEEFLDRTRSEARGGYPSLGDLFMKLECYMNQKLAKSEETPVNIIRRQVLEQCRLKAEHAPAIFSLTVPTGGGKTLSSLSFGLKHALNYKKDRLIYVIPYLSIIEQTVDVFREIFDEAVVEHHSHIVEDNDEESGPSRARLSAENWDAPIIVTTAVQFFESLFASRPGRCRKLHNIVNSVVVLDEVQLFPPDFLKPILKVLQELQQHYGVSLVLCTATQPAFDPFKTFDYNFEGLPRRTEIVADPLELHRKMQRVRIHLPLNLDKPQTWEEVAEQVTKHDSVLIIVNTRGQARKLFRLLPPGAFHLSAAMCGQHRSKVIKEIKAALEAGLPVRVVSTQLVECGVDLDFPVVFRALAGLDSIAQAAGRCNREGLLPYGDVYIFVPPRPSPPGHLRQAENACRMIIKQQPDDLLNPCLFQEYFKQLFWIKDNLDKHEILKDLAPDIEGRFLFKTAAAKFKIISDDHQPVLIKWGKGYELIEKLRIIGPNRRLLRMAQRYVVNVPRRQAVQLLAQGDLASLGDGIIVQVNDNLYDDQTGFDDTRSSEYQPEDLYC